MKKVDDPPKIAGRYTKITKNLKKIEGIEALTKNNSENIINFVKQSKIFNDADVNKSKYNMTYLLLLLELNILDTNEKKSDREKLYTDVFKKLKIYDKIRLTTLQKLRVVIP